MDTNGNLRLPDGSLFASRVELEALTDEGRKDLFDSYREACREYSRI